MSITITPYQAAVLRDLRDRGYPVGACIKPHEAFPGKDNAARGKRKTLAHLRSKRLLLNAGFGGLRLTQEALDALARHESRPPAAEQKPANHGRDTADFCSARDRARKARRDGLREANGSIQVAEECWACLRRMSDEDKQAGRCSHCGAQRVPY